MNKYLKGTARMVGRATAWTLERGLAELALPAAILSTTSNGNYFQRGLAGVTTTANAIYGGVESYANNTGVRDVVNGFGSSVLRTLADVADNIGNDPETAFYAALGTFVACKTIPFASKKTRSFLRNKRDKKEKINQPEIKNKV